MKTTAPRIIILTAILVAALGPAASRADLFVLTNNFTDPIYRIDTGTFTVTQTYATSFPTFVSPAFSGLAFDGRSLSWTSDSQGFTELHQIDAASGFEFLPTFVPDIQFPEGISGLGAVPHGGGALLGITRQRVALPEPLPTHLYQIEPFSGFVQFLGELPAEYRPVGLDVDDSTGEIWIAVQHPSLQRIELLNVEVASPFQNLEAVLSEDVPASAAAPPSLIIKNVLAPAVTPGSIRGLGFDNGRMFAISTTGFLYEIDPTSGGVLFSTQLPIAGLVAGLAGGTVVPEPAAAMLLSAGVIAGTLRRRRTAA